MTHNDDMTPDNAVPAQENPTTPLPVTPQGPQPAAPGAAPTPPGGQVPPTPGAAPYAAYAPQVPPVQQGKPAKRRTWIVAGVVGAVGGMFLMGAGIGLGTLISERGFDGDDDYIVHGPGGRYHDRYDDNEDFDFTWNGSEDSSGDDGEDWSDAEDFYAGWDEGSLVQLPSIGVGGVAMSDDIELTGQTLTDAATAAINAVGGEGVVIDAEPSSSRNHAYEVEVRLPSGEDVDVDLDKDFGVVRVDQ